MKIVRARGADFAFPSTTTFLASDAVPEAKKSLVNWPKKDGLKAR